MQYEVQMKETKLAIVLLDIVGSTKFVQRYGALHAAKLFQAHDRLARSLCYKFNGREIDRSDGFLLSFDRTIDAVNFALIYQRDIPPKTKLQCRIGIHWGSIIEVTQDDVFVAANAKKVELEGLSKNIAARTMSLCQGGQILLTKEAMLSTKRYKANMHTPKETKYVCVGLYKFKGVSDPQEIYAVGTSIESLQPPPGSEKVKRLGGPKKIKSRLRDKKLKEIFWWITNRIAILSFLWITWGMWSIISNPYSRKGHGIDGWWFYPIDALVYLINVAIELYRIVLEIYGF